MDLWIGDGSSECHFKAIIIYMKALEDSLTVASHTFMPKSPLTEAPSQPSNLPKMAPGSMGFVLCEGSRDII